MTAKLDMLSVEVFQNGRINLYARNFTRNNIMVNLKENDMDNGSEPTLNLYLQTSDNKSPLKGIAIRQNDSDCCKNLIKLFRSVQSPGDKQSEIVGYIIVN